MKFILKIGLIFFLLSIVISKKDNLRGKSKSFKISSILSKSEKLESDSPKNYRFRHSHKKVFKEKNKQIPDPTKTTTTTISTDNSTKNITKTPAITQNITISSQPTPILSPIQSNPPSQINAFTNTSQPKPNENNSLVKQLPDPNLPVIAPNKSQSINITNNISSQINNSTAGGFYNTLKSKGFDHVDFIKKLSNYAVNDFKKMEDPNYKSTFMIGKPYYIENNMTFDQNPMIISDVVETRKMNVINAKHSFSKESMDLWLNGERNYQDVNFKDGKNKDSPKMNDIYENPNIISKKEFSKKTKKEEIKIEKKHHLKTKVKNENSENLKDETENISNPLKNDLVEEKSSNKILTEKEDQGEEAF